MKVTKDFVLEYQGHIYHVEENLHDNQANFDVHVGLEAMSPTEIRDCVNGKEWPGSASYLVGCNPYSGEPVEYTAALLLTNGQVIGERGPGRLKYTLYPDRMTRAVRAHMMEGKSIRRTHRRRHSGTALDQNIGTR